MARHRSSSRRRFSATSILTTPLIAELARRGPVDVVVTPAGAAAARESSRRSRPSSRTTSAAPTGRRCGLWQTIREIRARASPTTPRTSRRDRCAAGSGDDDRRDRERVGFATSAGRVSLHDTASAYRAGAASRRAAAGRWRVGRARSHRAAIRARPRLYPGGRRARPRSMCCSRRNGTHRRAARRARARQRLGDQALAVLSRSSRETTRERLPDRRHRIRGGLRRSPREIVADCHPTRVIDATGACRCSRRRS